MKLKQHPADFQVEERTEVVAGTTGDYALYRLSKTGWTTPDAIQAIRRRWNLDPRRVSYGGMKDRHAETSQHLTIFRGPQRDLNHERIQLTFLGMTAEPFTSQQITANRFRITLRDLTAASLRSILGRIEEVRTVGVPNYFDDQRFGSVSADGEFVARSMVRGDFEQALRLALTHCYEYDRAAQKREKAILLAHWGDWQAAKAKLVRGHARSLVDYLCHHPTDFRGAVARLRPELQGLYLSAFQSDLWNRMLARWLLARFPPDSLAVIEHPRRQSPVPTVVPESVCESWATIQLPLPSARLKPDTSAEWWPMLQEVLAEEELPLERMKIPGLHKPFFSRGERSARILPTHWMNESGDDEFHRNRRKLTLGFDLPRGCYATMVVKRLTAVRGIGSNGFINPQQR